MKFDKNIPIPSESDLRCKAGKGRSKYEAMEVGDSYFTLSANKGSAIGSIRTYSKQKNLGWEFAVRQEGEGWRVWRVK